jgi:hypothetical protein
MFMLYSLVCVFLLDDLHDAVNPTMWVPDEGGGITGITGIKFGHN